MFLLLFIQTIVALLQVASQTTDCYDNFRQLTSRVNRSDYRIQTQSVDIDNSTIVIAIHGGNPIEGMTETLAKEIADNRSSYYIFEALRRVSSSNDACVNGPSSQFHNSTLHLTSVRYDEPTAMQMVAQKSKVISLHGFADITDRTRLEMNEVVCLGGLDKELIDVVETNLLRAAQRSTPFIVVNCRTPKSSEHSTFCQRHSHLIAANRNNIVNNGRTLDHGGVQLEMSTSLRNMLRDNFRNGQGRTNRREFVDAMREVMNMGIEQYNRQRGVEFGAQNLRHGEVHNIGTHIITPNTNIRGVAAAIVPASAGEVSIKQGRLCDVRFRFTRPSAATIGTDTTRSTNYRQSSTQIWFDIPNTTVPQRTPRWRYSVDIINEDSNPCWIYGTILTPPAFTQARFDSISDRVPDSPLSDTELYDVIDFDDMTDELRRY